MNNVDQLFKKYEIGRDGSDARTNQNTVECLLLKSCSHDLLCCFSKVNVTMVCIKAKSLETFFGSGDSSYDFIRGKARKSSEFRRREINQRGV